MGKYLTIDDQTFSDLEVFGKPGKPSVFGLFNCNITQGGSRLMEDLLKSPLGDVLEINRRSALYNFFAQAGLNFPLASETVNGLQYYMENEDVRSQISAKHSGISGRLQDLVAMDAGHSFVQEGVSAFLSVLNDLDTFIHELKVKITGSGYEQDFTILTDLLSHSFIEDIRRKTRSVKSTRIDKAMLAEVDNEIRFNNRSIIISLLEKISELDVAIAVGKTAKQRGFNFALALPAGTSSISIKGLVHPFLINPVSNDVEFDEGHNLLFLTGANMAGKSTLMKSIGLAMYLGHTGFPVPANSCAFAVRDGIFTTVNIADNLSMGASHYYAEVLRVKEVVKCLQQGRNIFVIFDELFRGTNVRDAHDATLAITRSFLNCRGSQFVLSTHIIEAGEKLEHENAHVIFKHLPTHLIDGKPSYPRVLKPGLSSDRHGMIIINNEGIIEMLENGIKEKANAI
jgi:DNA mismatch repair protein MutS